MILRRLKDRLSLFRVLQIIGWTGYTLDRYLSEPRFLRSYMIYVPVACALSFGLRPIYRRVWAARPSLLRVGLTAFAGSIIAAYLWLLIAQVIFWLLGWMAYPKDLTWFGYLAETFRYTLIHHKPFLFLSWSALYFGIKYWRDLQEQEPRALRLAALAREAELQMLRYQLNPHFLFNSLNSAGALVREDPGRAERMLGELSEFLRYSLTRTKAPDVSLHDELEAARNYLSIEKIRFEDKLAVSFQVAPVAAEFRVPSLLVHPLVENAVKYGMQTSPLPLTIEVIAQADNGSLHLEVINTGRWVQSSHNGSAPKRNDNGIGLQNVRQRLEQSFPGQHRFDVFERGGRVHAVLEIERDNGRRDQR
ncbi:MAG TPA: histidine kinase [Blastocatellia bacterium]|nr:histidine kinase [Blastocatellia bacterium]